MTELKERVDEALDRAAPESAQGSKRYSVRDLEAFQLNVALIHELEALDPSEGETLSARESLRDCLRRLTDGCHPFQPELKAASFIEARRSASEALADLALLGGPSVDRVAERLEVDLLKKLRGLIRRAERA